MYIHQGFFLISDALDELDDRVKNFFRKCSQSNAKQEWKDEQFEKIKKVWNLDVTKAYDI